MQWVVDLIKPVSPASQSVASSVLILMLVAFVGLSIGSIKFRGLGLGIAGVLFAGLAFGHFHITVNHEVMYFAREFGLILFVYTIGVQVGPGFFASLRQNGLVLNAMAAVAVLLGAAIAVGLWAAFMQKSDLPAAVGLLSGAVTNTPSLAAALGALQQVGASESALAVPSQAYAVAYPFGIMGIISAMLLTKKLFKVDLTAEQESFTKAASAGRQHLDTMNLEVKNPALFGRRLAELPLVHDHSGVIISRLLRSGQAQVAKADSVLAGGDVLFAVGPTERLADLKLIVGDESTVDVRTVPSAIEARRVLVTRKDVTGRSIHDLQLPNRFGVNITRIYRNEIELPVTADAKLQIGDNLIVVGEATSMVEASKALGNSTKQLDHPQIIPVFVGIALGVLLGSMPISLPGVPVPVKLGLAGGPMIVAILLSRLGRVGPLVWYMPLSANFMLREVGIVLFLAGVGLGGGETFVAALKGHGVQWFLFGAIITFVPLILVAALARAVLKLNFMTLCGLLAGSMTDPPALAFAGTITGSEAPSIAYATVYPLTMLLRVLIAQLIILFLFK
jgi:putative transport protein